MLDDNESVETNEEVDEPEEYVEFGKIVDQLYEDEAYLDRGGPPIGHAALTETPVELIARADKAAFDSERRSIVQSEPMFFLGQICLPT